MKKIAKSHECRTVARLLVLVGFALTQAVGAATEPFVPSQPDFVLERLPIRLSGGETDSDSAKLKELRKAHASAPDDLAPAVKLARVLASRASSEGDPRYLGQAEAVLRVWWSATNAPVEVLVLKGVIEQSRHQFSDAITTLRRAAVLDPRDPQAWLTVASIYTVRGEYDEARRACARLAPLADPLTLVTATASVASLTGSAEASLMALEAALLRAKDANDERSVAARIWAETLAAEIGERLGRTPVAERHFESALRLRPSDPYALGAYADFLLNANRPKEVIELLAKHHRLDALLMRAAEAERMIDGVDSLAVAADIATLQARFDEMRLRGERVHMREEARLRLRLLHDASAAAELAKDNWNVQREPADVRLLLETGLAAGDAAMQSEAREWVRSHRLEDAVFAQLDSAKMARP